MTKKELKILINEECTSALSDIPNSIHKELKNFSDENGIVNMADAMAYVLCTNAKIMGTLLESVLSKCLKLAD